MKVSIVKPLALAGSLACMAAFQVAPVAAQEIYPSVDAYAQQTAKTRAQVRTEYLQALQEGSIPGNAEFDEGPFGGAMSAQAAVPSSLTREEVLADAIEWMRLHRGDLDMGSR